MNQIIDRLQTLKLPKFITVFLVAFAFLIIPAFSYNPSIQAQAEPLTPEATQYQVNSKDSPFGTMSKRKLIKSLKTLKSLKPLQKPLERLEKI
jgi:predicted PurR-regulated permease PerM